RKTAEHARFTKELCREKGFRKVILVTSAYHMPRSAALFRREGVDFIPCPCDYMTNRDLVLDVFAFTPGHGNLSVTAIAMKEYLGLLAVKAGLQ
ncbi:MAG: YdcF family protein, partial [Acidaminococcaceae bacterium]|nr:YdcF family protein [Acidaminococcaceae bacterium]